MGTVIKHPAPDRVSSHPDTPTLRAERQSARISKITNDGLTRSGTGCFIRDNPYGNSGRRRVNLTFLQILYLDKSDQD